MQNMKFTTIGESNTFTYLALTVLIILAGYLGSVAIALILSNILSGVAAEIAYNYVPFFPELEPGELESLKRRGFIDHSPAKLYIFASAILTAAGCLLVFLKSAFKLAQYKSASKGLLLKIEDGVLHYFSPCYDLELKLSRPVAIVDPGKPVAIELTKASMKKFSEFDKMVCIFTEKELDDAARSTVTDKVVKIYQGNFTPEDYEHLKSFFEKTLPVKNKFYI